MDGPHVVEYPLAVLVNMVELHVVNVVLPRRLHHAVLLPVAPSVRHVTLNESIRLLSERLSVISKYKRNGCNNNPSLDVDRREGCVGEVVVRNGHVVVAADPDAARRPEAAHGMRLLACWLMLYCFHLILKQNRIVK